MDRKLSNINIIVANTWVKRLVGLLGHRSLGDGEAMFFNPGASIHTIGMRFAIDVLYLDSNNKVIKIVQDMKPFRFSFAPKGTCSVLELNSGNIKRTGIYLEDTLVIG